jgi:hypothetical protein
VGSGPRWINQLQSIVIKQLFELFLCIFRGGIVPLCQLLNRDVDIETSAIMLVDHSHDCGQFYIHLFVPFILGDFATIILQHRHYLQSLATTYNQKHCDFNKHFI